MSPSRLRLAASSLLLAAVLSGCATPIPPTPGGDAFVSIGDTQTLDQLLAQKVDGHTNRDARYFDLRPGNHTLMVLIEHQGYTDEAQDCFASIHYRFKAGEHYAVAERIMGDQATAVLQGAHGKALARAVNLTCSVG